MGNIVLNRVTVKRLEGADGPTQIRDELGRIIGTFHPTIKISAEHPAELEELRKLPPGRKLADVTAVLKAN